MFFSFAFRGRSVVSPPPPPTFSPEAVLLFRRRLMRASSSGRRIFCCKSALVVCRGALRMLLPDVALRRVPHRGLGSVLVIIHPERQRAVVLKQMHLYGAGARIAVCKVPRHACCPCATSRLKRRGAILSRIGYDMFIVRASVRHGMLRICYQVFTS